MSVFSIDDLVRPRYQTRSRSMLAEVTILCFGKMMKMFYWGWSSGRKTRCECQIDGASLEQGVFAPSRVPLNKLLNPCRHPRTKSLVNSVNGSSSNTHVDNVCCGRMTQGEGVSKLFGRGLPRSREFNFDRPMPRKAKINRDWVSEYGND